MKTEPVFGCPAERDVYQLSPALCAMAPRHVDVRDQHGRPVELTLAGYPVRPGQAYELRAQLEPAEGEAVKPRIIDSAGLVEQQGKPETRREGDADWLMMRFRIRRRAFWLRSILGLLWYHTIQPGEIIFEWEYSRPPQTRAGVTVPLLVRKPLLHAWGLLWFVSWFAIGVGVEWLLRLWHEGRWSEAWVAVRHGDVAALLALVSVTFVGLVALTWPLARIFWNMWSVLHRAHEMHRRYADKYANLAANE